LGCGGAVGVASRTVTGGFRVVVELMPAGVQGMCQPREGERE
jgi:hypothetical protein